MEVTMEMLFLFLVLGRSQVIALRGSYNDGCRRKQFRWSLAETWSRLSRHRVVHIHVIKDKRSKLDPSGKKGIFVGYSETSKAYRVYIPGYRQIEISRDVTFDEDATFSRSRQHHTDEIHDEEPKAPRVVDTDAGNDVVPVEHGPEDHDMAEPQRPAETNTKKRRPLGLVKLFRMSRSMVLQMDLSEKARNLDHIPVMWHCYVISLMLSLPVMKRLQKRKYGRMP
jgi:hypothetical protein